MDLLSGSGLCLVGQVVEMHTRLRQDLNWYFPKRPDGIPTGDVVVAYLASLCLGKNDFEAVRTLEEHVLGPESLGIKAFPSPETVRQRLDDGADLYLYYVQRATPALLTSSRAPVTPLACGHVALDVDVTTLDNSQSKKEGIGYTYAGTVGYAPIAAYLGQEGWCLGFELREGTQHCQQETPAFLRRVLAQAVKLTQAPILLRMDAGNDARENFALCRELEVDFLVKHNWRSEDLHVWTDQALALPDSAWTHPRPGKREVLLSRWEEVFWKGKPIRIRMVVRVIERISDATGKALTCPIYGLDSWITSLDMAEAEVVRLYDDHGTSEQFHSELKTDLDLERLPSGKFVTNAFILELGAFAYNLLRLLGQLGLDGFAVRHPTQRQRVRTIIQELIYVAARVAHTARQVLLVYGRKCAIFERMQFLQERLC